MSAHASQGGGYPATRDKTRRCLLDTIDDRYGDAWSLCATVDDGRPHPQWSATRGGPLSDECDCFSEHTIAVCLLQFEGDSD